MDYSILCGLEPTFWSESGGICAHSAIGACVHLWDQVLMLVGLEDFSQNWRSDSFKRYLVGLRSGHATSVPPH